MRFVIVDDGDVMYHNPLGPDKANELQNLLRQGNCFVPSFATEDPYAIETYVVQYATHQTNVVFLLDRNIYSQVLSLAKGAVVNEKTRFAAGIMAFASCANATIEPGLALYEGAASGARGGWRRDLSLLRGADNINPINWASLALGVFDRFTRKLPRQKLEFEAAKFNPSMRLKSFAFVYPIMLKIAILSRLRGSEDLKMSALLDWMYYSWQFSAPATILAMQMFSSNRPKGAFKRIGSTEKAMVLAGVGNTAWDLVYITEWFKRIKKQAAENEMSVICSRDALLIKTAELLRQSMFEDTAPEFLLTAGFGKDVQGQYDQYMRELDDTRRALMPRPKNFDSYRKKLIAGLEGELIGAG
jgi:hypothetical protein